MPVLMIGEVPNLTEEIYGSLARADDASSSGRARLHRSLRRPPPHRWRVVEMWDSEEDSQRWFDENVKPNLPPDIVPTRTYYELLSAFTA
jgi:hypothetical protein